MNDFELQSPMAIANFVINFAKAQGKPVSNLQLQKILYFIQTAFLVEQDHAIIRGKFSRWQYGPVLQEVYSSYRDNGAATIDELAINITKDDSGEYTIGAIEGTNANLLNSEEAFEFLERVTSRLLEQDPWDLVNISHEQNIWEKYEKQIAMHIAPDYEDEEILSEGEQVRYLWA
jgi:uncharacterized phage-associated protein